jgi:hypothetical protein
MIVEPIPAEETAPSPQRDKIMQQLSYLQEALEANDPMIKRHLGEIHKLMIQHEELVHLLSDDEIAKIMGAQQIVTNTTLVAATTGKTGKATATKKAAQLSLGDL